MTSSLGKDPNSESGLWYTGWRSGDQAFSSEDQIYADLEEFADNRKATILTPPYSYGKSEHGPAWIRAKIMMPEGDRRRVYINDGRWMFADSGPKGEKGYRSRRKARKAKEALESN